MVDVLEDGPTVGTVTVHTDTGWEELSRALTETLTSHFHLLTAGKDGGKDLGLSADSVCSVLIGESPSPRLRVKHREHSLGSVPLIQQRIS